jgi:hypothetical protein
VRREAAAEAPLDERGALEAIERYGMEISPRTLDARADGYATIVAVWRDTIAALRLKQDLQDHNRRHSDQDECHGLRW